MGLEFAGRDRGPGGQRRVKDQDELDKGPGDQEDPGTRGPKNQG